MPMIFLTGMPRCGSTWAGRALAHLTGSRYIHEPLNGHRDPELAAFNMRYSRPGACDPALIQILQSRARSADRRVRLIEFMQRRQNVVIKEVHGTLAVACVDRHLRPDVVVLIRHPCGVAASWKRLGWLAAEWAEGDPLLEQTTLVEDHLSPFQSHILSSRDPYFRLGAYWGAIHYVLHRLAALHPRWQWVTHEDLCSSPGERFAALLHALGQKAQPGSYSFFEAYDRPPAQNEGPFDIYRQTVAQPEKWRSVLTAEEVGKVLTGAAPFGMDELLRTPAGAGEARQGAKTGRQAHEVPHP